MLTVGGTCHFPRLFTWGGLLDFTCAIDSRNFVLFQVEQSKVLIKEGGVQLTLTIVDTPGFGDAVDNSNW